MTLFSRVRKSKGNIFAMLFAAVGMTGVLGVVGMQTVSGPITTITKVTQKNIVDTDLMTNARIVILNAGIQALGGDGDSDNYVEPVEYNTTCTAAPTGGGCLPIDIGAIQTDPWGTSYGYCVWDHGLTDNGKDDGGTGADDRLQGAESTSEAVIAIISAGRDKTFQTICGAFDGAGTDGLLEAAGSDDSVRVYSYDAAVAGANGLWQIKSGDPSTAEINQDLEIGTFDDALGTGFHLDTATGVSKFPSVTTDILTAWTGNNVEMAGGLRLDDQAGVTSCGAGDAGAIRYNTVDQTIEVCDGAGDWDGADETLLSDEDGDTLVQVEEGADDDTIRFDTAGTERMVIEADGDVVIDTDSFFVDESTGYIGMGELSPDKQLHLTGDGFILLENALGNQAGVNIGDASGTLHLTSNHDVTPSGIDIQRDGDVAVNSNDLFVDASANAVGVGTTSPIATLEVVGNISSKGGSIHLQRPTSGGGWARGMEFLPDGSYSPTTEGLAGVGFHGTGAGSPSNIYLAHGAAPWSSTAGIQILANGRVGIGTVAPSAKVHVHNSDSANAWADTLYTNPGTGTTATDGFWVGYSTVAGVWNYENTRIIFGTDNQNRMRIEANGNVGIGAGASDTLLDVDGPIEISAGGCTAASHAGRIQYTTAKNIEYCPGAGGWTKISGYVDYLNQIGDVEVTGVTSGQTLMWNGTQWVATSTLNDVGTGDTDLLVDNDNDTKVQVEKNADEDYIRFDTAGSERMHIAPNGRIGINQDFDTTDNEATVAITASAATSTGVAIKTSTNVALGADLYMHGSGVLATDNYMYFYIDGDNSSTNAYFDFRKDSKMSGGVNSENLMRIHEDGYVALFAGDLRIDENGDGDYGFVTESGLGGIGLAGNSANLASPDLYVTNGGNVGINTTSAVAALEVGGTDAILFPRGIVGNRPAVPVNGMMRYNTATGKFEAYQGGAWQDILTSGAGNVAHALADADNDTKIQVEETADDDTIRFDTAGLERMVIFPTGEVQMQWHLATGVTSGGVGLTVNDGYGNASVTFNHLKGTPEQNGNAGRIEVNTDATSNAIMSFELLSNVLDGVATPLNEVMRLSADGKIALSGTDTDGTVTITGAPDISSVNTAGQGGLVIQDSTGDAAGAKLRIDANELQTSSAGATTSMGLNPYGGNVSLFGSGGVGVLDMNSRKITELATPTAGADAANKTYVDSRVNDGTGDSGTLDGLDSTDFIRSNVNDDVTAHTEWQDNMQVRLGNDADFRMYFNGADAVARSYFHGGRYILQGEDLGGTNRNMLVADPDGTLSLHYAGAGKLSTTATGVSITGRITNLTDPTGNQDAATKKYVDDLVAGGTGDSDTVDGLHAASFIRSDANDNVTGHTEWQDNMEVRLGAGADFRMYHNGTDTYMRSYLHGSRWILQGENLAGTNRSMIIADPDGAVNIYHAGVNAVSTQANGLTVRGNTPQVILGDTDAGYNSGSLYGSGNSIGLLDRDAQWAMQHVRDSYTRFVINNTEEMRINPTTIDMKNNRVVNVATPTATLDAANKAYVDALVPANSTNADTVDGLHAASFIRSDANDNVSGHTEWQDNFEIRLGTGADFRMDFDGTNTVMRSYAHGSSLYLQGEDTGGTNRNMIIGDPDSHVRLYYQGAEKLRTTTTGIEVRDMVSAMGATSGNEGGEIRLHTSDANDGTYDYYFVDVFQDDLRIGRAGNGDDFIMKDNSEIRMSNQTLIFNQAGSNGNAAIGSDIKMTSSGMISADDDLYINMDANNNSTGAQIRFGNNASTSGSGGIVFTIRETGIIKFKSISGVAAPTK